MGRHRSEKPPQSGAERQKRYRARQAEIDRLDRQLLASRLNATAELGAVAGDLFAQGYQIGTMPPAETVEFLKGIEYGSRQRERERDNSRAPPLSPARRKRRKAPKCSADVA
jgi:hypothetical protein